MSKCFILLNQHVKEADTEPDGSSTSAETEIEWVEQEKCDKAKEVANASLSILGQSPIDLHKKQKIRDMR